MIYYDFENKKYNIDFNENFSRKISIHLFGQMSIPIKQKEIISFGDIIIELIPNLNNSKHDLTYFKSILPGSILKFPYDSEFLSS